MIIKKCLALSLSLIICICCFASCSDKNNTSSNEDVQSKVDSETDVPEEVKEIRDINSWDLVKEMSYGWNLGNTMDALGTGSLDDETSWQATTTTKEMVDFLKQDGFNVLRVPVSWGEHMDENYTVDAQWMARVREIVDYGIENDMFVILNTHHEEWYYPTEDNKTQDIEQIKALWSQIAEEFKGYDEHLIFEGLNEPRQRDSAKEWTGGDDVSRKIVNEYAAAFYDTVRNSGGNNADRHLMITGYAASSQKNCLEAIELSNFDDKVIVSVHAYLPYSFALDLTGTDKFDANTDAVAMDSLFTNLNEIFLSKEIPVIIGEYGNVSKENIEDRIECTKYYLEAAKNVGVPCIWWDNALMFGTGETFGLMERSMPSWYFPEIVDTIKEIYE